MRTRLNDVSFSRRSFCGTAAALAATTLWPWSLPAEEKPGFPPADSWPNFRNGVQLRGIARTTLPARPSLKWELPADDGVRSTPAIVDGRVYVGTLSGDLYCLELENGKELWKYQSLIPTNPRTFIPGFSSPVTVTANRVFCGDEDGILHCLDRETGKPVWKHNAEGLIVGAATVIGDRVIFGSHRNYLLGVSLETGEKLWEFDAKGPVNGTQAFSGETTFVSGCSEPLLYAVNSRTGEQEQTVPIGDMLIATPALVDGILYFGTAEGKIMAVDWTAGATVWKKESRQGREMHSSPAVTDDRVVIGGRDKLLYCFGRENGDEVWTFATRAGNDNSPVIAGERVYFGSGDKNVYAVDLATGKATWTFNSGSSFGESSPAIAEKHLVICNDSPGRILCFG